MHSLVLSAAGQPAFVLAEHDVTERHCPGATAHEESTL
jgi:hypothetical protein